VIELLKRASLDNAGINQTQKSLTLAHVGSHVIRQDVIKRPQLNTPGHSTQSADLAQVARRRLGRHGAHLDKVWLIYETFAPGKKTGEF